MENQRQGWSHVLHPISTRREFFTRAGSGLAGIALASLLKAEDPLAPKQPQLPPKAKSVIWLFMEGGPSHVDLFDPKPKLAGAGGKPMPDSIRQADHGHGHGEQHTDAVRRAFKQYGQSGIWVSDWYPEHRASTSTT